ncbi:conjugal transfer protein TraF [uncultured Tateyamaria sp.]|uniref:conjugal transfer protein TraF n=1 Tax=uncultured Tateyamaria sp. TaxID=455651 RepID=UPI002613AA9D|nr:conjugal transfer protein TraF [uncultured Tateyamaria sp.]
MNLRFPAYVLSAVLLSTSANAKLLCNGEEINGWHFYCDPEPAPDPLKKVEPQPEQQAEEIPADPEPMTATEEIEAYRKYTDELKHRAILDPTPENVEAYMRANMEMAQMASRFAAVWQRVLFQTPELDANTRRPLTQMGTNIYQDQKNAAEEAALRRAASEAGFLFVYDDPVECRICLAQAEILVGMRDAYGIEILAVSTDGSPMQGFPEAVPNEGQLEALGIDDLPRPFIAIVETETGEVSLIGGGLLTADQILDRVYVVREVLVGERFQ